MNLMNEFLVVNVFQYSLESIQGDPTFIGKIFTREKIETASKY